MSLITAYRKADMYITPKNNAEIATNLKPASLVLIAIGFLGLIAVGPISNDVRIHLPHDLLAYQILIFGYLMSANYFLLRRKPA